MQANKLIETLGKMKGDTLNNYVILGLNSSLINKGCVRYFECTRDHQDTITPHTHRFGFTCLVLAGEVMNTLWERTNNSTSGDEYQVSNLEYLGSVGEHKVVHGAKGLFLNKSTKYVAGETYSMSSNQFHSIKFSKGAKVLFFEEPSTTKFSAILEPIVDGEVIHTYKTEDYMFKKGVK